MIDSDLGAVSKITQDQALECFKQSISNIAAYNNINYADFQALQLEVIPLVENPQRSLAVGLVEQLCKKYAWALRPVSVLFATVIAED